MDFIRTVMLHLIFVSMSCSVPIIFLILLSPLLRKIVTAKHLLFVYKVLFLRALFFFQIPLPISIPDNPTLNVVVALVVNPNVMASNVAEAVNAMISTNPEGMLADLTCTLFILWISSAAFLIVKHFSDHTAFCKNEFLYSENVTDPITCRIFDKIKKDIRYDGQITLREFKKNKSPISCTFLIPRILLPNILSHSDSRLRKMIGDAGLEYILRHEIFHVKRNDYFWLRFVKITCAIHYFNPFFVKLEDLFLNRIEAARDIDVCNGSQADAEAYGKVLVIMNQFISVDKEIAEAIFAFDGKYSFFVNDRVADLKIRRSPLFSTVFTFLLSVLIALTVFSTKDLILQSDALIQNIVAVNTAVSTERVVAPVSHPIPNATEILIPSKYERFPDRVINELLYRAKAGTDIYAPVSGTIIDVGYDFKIGLGNFISVKNDDVIVTVGQLSSIDFNIGDRVSQNDLIGKVGESGIAFTTGCQIIVTDINRNPVDLSAYSDKYVPKLNK